ncbi:alpha/beta hydrolase fold-1 [Cordyceps fumosorosea ARSEF 2679]|uniref:Alpha/beta hydrolase fold-1 n=1 Tax=Cordyceps fumosorosea (strain ARSEF 2679) TaxID=1081104 RepID=A0A167V5K2_CORFA|nr:alpha/beta hydrolase fold-1 [Cordyceps fumosorosea ARSEF 2679]OAA62249.1 alpha/beta hydrolase fold-1 [Cordyceps fumosorosea ARSEF 2679]
MAPTLLTTTLAIGAAPFLFYAVLLGVATIPSVQRHALYAHKINTLFLYDVNEPTYWGFAKNQVTPFTLTTQDQESIYAWHILPLPLYYKNENSLAVQPSGLAADITETEAFKLLKVHGNAGHIAQGMRPETFHALTDTSSYHVLSIDYRGFGYSTGMPSEAGLIQDARALVEWAINEAGVPPSRIVILGQSLGTAVASGVAEIYSAQGVEFAGIVLVAGFSDLATMIGGYRMGGIVPLLGPFSYWPAFVKLLDRFVIDKWHSADRLVRIVRQSKTRLRLSLLHAKDDSDIPYTEDNKLFKAAAGELVGSVDEAEFGAMKEQRTIHKGEDAAVTTWKAEPDIIIRQELVPYGGHNYIMGSSNMIMAVQRCFDD